MKNFDEQIDITKNIKMIEMLKYQILNSVADLHSTFIQNTEQDEKKEIFSDLIILTYILANRLNINPLDLENKIIKKLKLAVLDEKDNFNEDIKELLRYFN